MFLYNYFFGSRMSWAYIDPPKEIIKKIKKIDELVPQEWRCDNKGNTSSSPIHQKYHITFLLKIPKDSNLKEVENFLNSTPKFKLTLEELYFSNVSRITSKNVYCIGWTVSSNILEELEKKCTEILGCTKGGKHSNIVYVTEEYKDKLYSIMENHKNDLKGSEFIVDSIVIMGRKISLKDDSEINYSKK